MFNSALESTDPQEYVSLVSYASDGTWCGVSNHASDIDQNLTDDLGLITSAVTTIGDRVFNGGTEISAGIDEAVGVLTDPSHARPFAAKTMIVLTDGNQLGGRSPVDAAQDAAMQESRFTQSPSATVPIRPRCKLWPKQEAATTIMRPTRVLWRTCFARSLLLCLSC